MLAGANPCRSAGEDAARVVACVVRTVVVQSASSMPAHGPIDCTKNECNFNAGEVAEFPLENLTVSETAYKQSFAQQEGNGTYRNSLDIDRLSGNATIVKRKDYNDGTWYEMTISLSECKMKRIQRKL
jgi:hypothetical protein